VNQRTNRRQGIIGRRTYLILTAVLASIYLLILSPEEKRTGMANSPEDELLNNSGIGIEKYFNKEKIEKYNRLISKKSEKLLKDESLVSWDELKTMALRGQMNLISKLWEIRRLCPENSSPLHCDQLVTAFIKNRYPHPDNQEMAKLFKAYSNYEERMRNDESLNQLPINERYDLMRDLRKEMFSPAEHALLFGFEESSYDYHIELGSFLESTNNLSGDVRKERWQQLQNQMLGDFQEAYLDQQDPFDQYEVVEELYSNEISSENGTDIQQQIREDFFGKEGAQRMKEVDIELAKEEQQIKTYKALEDEFLNNNKYLSESEKENQLQQLRIDTLGKDLAEQYKRRQAIGSSD
jgi:lipase chaperone LimK